MEPLLVRKFVNCSAGPGVGIECMAFGEMGYDRMNLGRVLVVIP